MAGGTSDDSWDGAYISGGTLRPVSAAPRSSSAVNVRDYEWRKRPSSKMSSESGSSCRGELSQYRRSLRLLGVAPGAPGQGSTSGSAGPGPRVKPAVSSAKPVLQTRLARRTVSTDDVRSAVLDESRSESEMNHRDLVAKAVYEEWYFRKQEEARKMREAQLQKEKEQRWKEEHERLEKERKSREKYEEWLNRKQEKKKIQSDNDKPGTGRGRRRGDKTDAEAAYQKWREEKEREAAEARKNKDRLEEERRAKEEKALQAQKAWESWKQRAEEEMKKTIAKSKEKEKTKEEEKERLKEERRKEAESSFRAWRESKDKQIQERLQRQRKREERKKAEEEKRRAERAYEAQQAFRTWLDSVLEKEVEKGSA